MAAPSSSSAGERENVSGNVGIRYPYEVKFRGALVDYKLYTSEWEVWAKKHEEWIDNNFTDDVNLNNLNEGIRETAEPSSDLIVPLLGYQKEWLAWALKQEESPYKGGILADEMGMGKTVQAIALVLAKRELHRSIGSGLNSPSTSAGSSTGSSEVRATLVVCPAAAVSRWVGEIFRSTSVGSTHVLMYQEANRSSSLDVEPFKEYDFVITTYSLVEIEYKNYVKPPTVKTTGQSKKQKEKNLDRRKRKFSEGIFLMESTSAPITLVVQTKRDAVRNLQDMVEKEVKMEELHDGQHTFDWFGNFVKDTEKCVVEGKINNVVESLGGPIFSSFNLGNVIIQVKP